VWLCFGVYSNNQRVVARNPIGRDDSCGTWKFFVPTGVETNILGASNPKHASFDMEIFDYCKLAFCMNISMYKDIIKMIILL